MIVIEPPSSDSGAAGPFQELRRPHLARFFARAQKAVDLEGEVTALLSTDLRLKDLNRTFRGKNKATDVLSFPAGDNADGIAGDLALSVETAARQAAEHGHTLEEELRILLLHGLLHLAGYDHEQDAGEMRARETELRARLGLPAGLIERTIPARRQARATPLPSSRAASRKSAR